MIICCNHFCHLESELYICHKSATLGLKMALLIGCYVGGGREGVLEKPKQGWRSGESVCLPPVWPGFNSETPTLYLGRVCCWFSSLLRGFFSGFSSFPPSTKTNTSEFQFDQEFRGPQVCQSQNPRKIKLIYYIFIYLIIYL